MITFLGLITTWYNETQDRLPWQKILANVECSGQNIFKHLFIGIFKK